ncbi:hypothetical protein [Robiginitalea sp. SC105]|uniref:hypothetical protein n=1 Tax=Robiginitalea sp. SC105 TaxID=2762332 RepID=UPI00163A7739|nr:hypothetical protein [Robiginitalea sp. SC105]MBC2839849.1 hypothetical protein [Robiginitalea sp. SC105]
MKLKKLVQWVELVANIAVVISVVYLSLEVQKNTKAIESQSIKDRSQRLNQPYINSPLIPSILAKIKQVDGPEPGEANLMNRYNLTYEEAAIYGRYTTEIMSGLEAEYIQAGPSQGLIERVQLLFLFPDIYIAWDNGYFPQIQSIEFKDYVSHIRTLPLAKMVSDYKNALDSLKTLKIENTDTIRQ